MAQPVGARQSTQYAQAGSGIGEDGKGLQTAEEGSAHTLHVGVMATSAIQLVFLVVMLADGRSVMKLKGAVSGDEAPEPVIHYMENGMNKSMTLRDLNGYPYGFGLHYDQYAHNWYSAGNYEYPGYVNTHPGQSWGLQDIYQRTRASTAYTSAATTDAKGLIVANDIKMAIANNPRLASHFAMFLSCENLQRLGRCLKAMAYLGCPFVFVALLLSAASMAFGQRFTIPAALVQIIVLGIFATLMIGLAAMWGTDFECNNQLIQELRCRDHFEVGYALPISACGVLLVFVNYALLYNVDEPGTLTGNLSEEEIAEAAKVAGEDAAGAHDSYVGDAQDGVVAGGEEQSK